MIDYSIILIVNKEAELNHTNFEWTKMDNLAYTKLSSTIPFLQYGNQSLSRG